MFRSHRSWFERQLHVFNPFCVCILRRCWTLLKAKSWFWRQFHVFKPFCWPPRSLGGPDEFAPLDFDIENGSKVCPTTAKNEVKQLTHFLTIFCWFWGQFWVHFGGHFGIKMGQEAPTWAQEGPQELQSTEKQHLQKMWFYNGETILFESWGLSRRA